MRKQAKRKSARKLRPPSNLPLTKKHWYGRWHDFPAHKEVHWLSVIAIAWGVGLALLSGLVAMKQGSDAIPIVQQPAELKRQAQAEPLEELNGSVLGVEDTVPAPIDEIRNQRIQRNPNQLNVKRP